MNDVNHSEVAGHAVGAQQYPGPALYIVATPIGNLADITLRALDCLKVVDAIAAEDTRMAKRLLAHFGIVKPCFAAHRHNEREAGAAIVARLQAGERIAYVSDAGTPAVSDPGAILVDAVRSAGFRVVPIPGVSAATCALSAAGLARGEAGGRFYFHGFLPAKRGEAKATLQTLAALSANLIFFEAPHRVVDTVRLFAEELGPKRRIVIARELTKLFESVHCCQLADARAWLEQDSNRQRGEFVLIVEGRTETDAIADVLDTALPTLIRLLDAMPLSAAVDLAAELTGVSRKMLYARALEMKKKSDSEETG